MKTVNEVNIEIMKALGIDLDKRTLIENITITLTPVDYPKVVIRELVTNPEELVKVVTTLSLKSKE